MFVHKCGILQVLSASFLVLNAYGCKFKTVSKIKSDTDFSAYCPGFAATNCRQTFVLNNGRSIYVYSNVDLSSASGSGSGSSTIDLSPASGSGSSSSFTSLIIAGHGAGGWPRGTFQSIADAISQDNKDNLATTAIVAPYWFGSLEDMPEQGEPKKFVEVWGDRDDFAAGFQSDTRPFSSYDVLLELANRVTETYAPNVKSLTFAGFSAGGQTMQHFAGLKWKGNWEDKGIGTRFIVGSPSSYLYWTNDRISDGAVCTGVDHCNLSKQFVGFPYDGCSEYNNYKFGLHNVPSYLKFNVNTYLERSVYYIVSTGDSSNTDVQPEGPPKDSCANLSEGPKDHSFRFERGLTYFSYLTFVVMPKNQQPKPIDHHLYYIDETNPFGGACKHSDHCVYGSDVGRALLLGSSSVPREWTPSQNAPEKNAGFGQPASVPQ